MTVLIIGVLVACLCLAIVVLQGNATASIAHEDAKPSLLPVLSQILTASETNDN